jgi:2'-5' RNA ligase
MSRLFLGTFLPEEDQARLRIVQQKNRELESRWNCRVRWVQPTKLHLTWLFLGDIEEARIAELEKGIEQIRPEFFSPGDLVYDRMEVWFGRDLPRHLVLTPSQMSDKLVRLVTLVRTKLIDFVAEDYRQQAKNQFRPHVTLMRFQKLSGEDPRLPLETKANGLHPFAERRKLRTKELPAGAIEGMADVLPIKHALDCLELISSNQAGSSHAYSIVKSFPLA